MVGRRKMERQSVWVIRLTSAKARGAIRFIGEMSFVFEFYLPKIKGAELPERRW